MTCYVLVRNTVINWNVVVLNYCNVFFVLHILSGVQLFSIVQQQRMAKLSIDVVVSRVFFSMA